jgi:rhodanese-related sulfurtransferase
MRKMLLAAALVAGCTKDPRSVAPVPVSIDQAAQQITAGNAKAVDANGEATRKHMGVVPGAVLLSDSETYQVSELPTDKSTPLVFYCANTACSASHQAAEKAVTAGYQHVEVMGDGIAGWVKAGKQTQQI